MEPILKTVAKAYSQRYNYLKEICFVFPNKRCGVFLRKYFAEYDIHTRELPHILTITELMQQIAKKIEASRIEQLFTLYNSYKKILKDRFEDQKEEIDFDAFRIWGETVLTDFNTVDFNLADPEEIFKNIKDYREIATNFLTEDQKDVIREYFGVDYFEEEGHFWKHFEGVDSLSPLKTKFINLWQILAPLHKDFISTLAEKGLSNAGNIYKEATQRVEEKGKELFPYKKLVMVGFNALTEAERRIFKALKKEEGYSGYDDFIDFVWDATGPILSGKDFSASRFINYNKRHFPSPEWMSHLLKKEEIKGYPEIRIISSPSNTSQAKIAGAILAEYNSTKDIEKISESEVAMVLPDESLLENVLFSLPDNLEDVNLTMGLSMRFTAVASFMTVLRRLYVNMTQKEDEKIFYVKDIKRLLAHSFASVIFEEENIGKFLEFVDTYHKIRVSMSEISGFLENAAVIFALPSKKIKSGEIFGFIRNLFGYLKEKFEGLGDLEEKERINTYEEYFNDLEETLKYYKIDLFPLSVIQMADRLLSGAKIGFEGEPLSGLQIMGTLETRSLDFRDVIILSVNEGVLPRKSITSTFIPDTLRKAYGLPPARYAEELFAYYFYRLISRAERVTLIYDGRIVSGMKGGESRYLLQLRQYCSRDKLKEESWEYVIQTNENEEVSVEKTDEIKLMTQEFCNCEAPKKNLSASSLNTYRECEVKFFLQNILNLNTDPDMEEYMDAISIGNVLHEVMMDLYMPEEYRKKLLTKPILITGEKLQEILDSPDIIATLVRNKIRKLYYKVKEDDEKLEHSGVTDIIALQIEELIREIIKHDISISPINLYGCEISKNLRIKLSSGREVNFRFAIDRLDEIEFEGEKRLRIVDYKTGQRKRKAENLEDVFEGGYKSEQIFQLFTYAWLLDKIGVKGSENVMTEIYFVPDFVKGYLGLPQIEGNPVTGFAEYKEEFSERFENMVESIFISEEFHQAKSPDQCNYCGFKTVCKKYVLQ